MSDGRRPPAIRGADSFTALAVVFEVLAVVVGVFEAFEAMFAAAVSAVVLGTFCSRDTGVRPAVCWCGKPTVSQRARWTGAPGRHEVNEARLESAFRWPGRSAH